VFRGMLTRRTRILKELHASVAQNAPTHVPKFLLFALKITTFSILAIIPKITKAVIPK